jgi:hypothetical protein
VRDEVPLQWEGNELRFEAPLGALGDDDGYFAYRLFTTEYGLTVSQVESRLLPPGSRAESRPRAGPRAGAPAVGRRAAIAATAAWARSAMPAAASGALKFEILRSQI